MFSQIAHFIIVTPCSMRTSRLSFHIKIIIPLWFWLAITSLRFSFLSVNHLGSPNPFFLMVPSRFVYFLNNIFCQKDAGIKKLSSTKDNHNVIVLQGDDYFVRGHFDSSLDQNILDLFNRLPNSAKCQIAALPRHCWPLRPYILTGQCLFSLEPVH